MRLVLADGVFDPLHTGHLAYLQAAQAQGDTLVVQVSPQRKRPQLFSQAERAEIMSALGYRVVRYDTTAQALRGVRPNVYCKGADWRDRPLPAEEQAVCAQLGIQVVYVQPDVVDSSTQRLRLWASQAARQGADELGADAHTQEVVAFDPERQGYDSFERRAAIEAEHPDILASLCQGKRVLDVGCGPGYLVRLLRERGIDAEGIDPHIPMGAYPNCYRVDLKNVVPHSSDVVVCREVLEHIPVREWGGFLYRLFRTARERVYLTTRFYLDPPHPFALTNEFAADPSHITVVPQPFVRALCALFGGVRDRQWESQLDWLHKDRVLVYQVTR